jgi:hypothetical protein
LFIWRNAEEMDYAVFSRDRAISADANAHPPDGRPERINQESGLGAGDKYPAKKSAVNVKIPEKSCSALRHVQAASPAIALTPGNTKIFPFTWGTGNIRIAHKEGVNTTAANALSAGTAATRRFALGNVPACRGLIAQSNPVRGVRR